MQMELIELQCNGTLKAKYDTEGPAQFTRFLPEAMPQLRQHAARILRGLEHWSCSSDQFRSDAQWRQR
ncbi:hypothetical protein FQN60_016048 [Etheostoma spectabile]|uniref:Uncharacterized protein n=1 Tax=Etheostoma spectabile TaxID=54343 RepID=A0A5J5C974_9PERO|nr:hypothetical protein FQN60_016048 [Etheostoma spectabile]